MTHEHIQSMQSGTWRGGWLQHDTHVCRILAVSGRQLCGGTWYSALRIARPLIAGALCAAGLPDSTIPDCLLDGSSSIQELRLGELAPAALVCPCVTAQRRLSLLSGCYAHAAVFVRPQLHTLAMQLANQTQQLGTRAPCLGSEMHVCNAAEFNNMGGSIPDVLTDTSPLRVLTALSAGLTGTIPASFSMCKELEILDLGYNFLEGTIPADIGNSRYLRYLYLMNNNLTGWHHQRVAVISTSSFENSVCKHARSGHWRQPIRAGTLPTSC